ncbi:MAG: ATPase domain-containing protein [Candidatus Thermoplasmatota archaeon]|nr:ATPase domain-containing protein [Candidatus Thermoplasmatota archaeon]
MFDEAPKPVEDGYEFTLEQDSLANAMGARLPNRSLWMIQGEVGSGKSLVSQRLIFGLLENGSKVLVITTELTTRGWIEQMESIGYPVTDYIASGMLMVFSRFGVIAEAKEGVDLFDVLESDAVEKADVVVVDSASALIPEGMESSQHLATLQKLRKICSESRSLLLTVDPHEMDGKLLHKLRSSCEVLLDMNAGFVGGEIKRTIVVTRFLRAAGPVQASVGWRVEPYMGFIVDITAVS